MLPSSILASRLVFGFGLTFALQLSSPYRGSILPSSILASRLVFGFGSTFAFQLRSPYRGFDIPSSILASRLIFGFGLTFAFQLSFTLPRIRCYPLRYSPLGLFLASVQLSLFSFRSPYRGSIFPSSILASRLVFAFVMTFAFQLRLFY